MKTLILAAGYATRLYPLTKHRPKPLLEVAGMPIIDHIVEKIARIRDSGEIIVVTNDKFFNHFKEWAHNSYFKKRIVIINDKTTTVENRLGAIGDISFVLKKKRINDDLLVVGGDNLFTFELSEFAEFARARRPEACVGLYDVHDFVSARKYGTVTLDNKHRIIDFLEKSKEPVSTLVSMCIYYFPREGLSRVEEYLKYGNNRDAPGHYINWLHKQEHVWGYILKGEWYDIGDIISFYHANVTYRRTKKKAKA